MTEIKITTEYIRLDSALKLSSAVSTGGEAKMVIQQGDVMVNNAVCTQRGKKLHTGDTILYNNKSFTIV